MEKRENEAKKIVDDLLQMLKKYSYRFNFKSLIEKYRLTIDNLRFFLFYFIVF